MFAVAVVVTAVFIRPKVFAEGDAFLPSGARRELAPLAVLYNVAPCISDQTGRESDTFNVTKSLDSRA